MRKSWYRFTLVALLIVPIVMVVMCKKLSPTHEHVLPVILKDTITVIVKDTIKPLIKVISPADNK